MYKKYNNFENEELTRRNSCCEQEENTGGRRWRCEPEEDEIGNNIYINTKIEIDQDANATGGDGGNGGEAEGGDAAYASDGLVNVALNELEIDADINWPTPLLNEELSKKAEAKPLQEPETNTGATGGDAEANGGDGGSASASNTATVDFDQVVVITINGDTPTTTRVATNNRNLEIKVNGNGEAFVNGVKMDEKELGDGTKVMVFKENSSIKKEKKR